MQYNKYLDDFYIEDLYEKYDGDYLNSIDADNFDNIYNLFVEKKFYFIEDIISMYIEIFTMEVDIVRERLVELESKLGDNYVYLIGEDLTLLNSIIAKE